MGKTTIEWCDYTFNPWIGCTKISPGCQHCYAEMLMDKRYRRVEWGPQGIRIRTSKAYWRKPLAWNKQAQAEGKRARVFCASLADVFEIRENHEQCNELQEWRHELFDLMLDTPWLDWLLLTKRPQNVTKCIQWYCGSEHEGFLTVNGFLKAAGVWIGTSVENQEQADKRIPHLLKIPAKVKFLSCEPLLERIDISIYMATGWTEPPYDDIVNWVIVGGESGPDARPMHPQWAQAIRGQCQAAGVPFFFKQWGEWVPYAADTHEEMAERIADDVDKWQWLMVDGREGPLWKKHLTTTMIKVGKKAAGRRLGGVEWSQFPEEEASS